MERRTLMSRVELLEKAVDDLQNLSSRVEPTESRASAIERQFLQLLARVDSGFSALQTEMAAGFATVGDRFGRVDERFAQIDERLSGLERQIVDVRADMRQGDDETRVFVRVLHEEVLSRIAMLGERY